MRKKLNSKNAAVYGTAIVSKIAVVLMALLSTALINRALGVALKGEYAYITNWASILVTVLALGTGQTYSTFRRQHGRAPLGTFVALTLIQSGLVLAAALGCLALGAPGEVFWALFIAAFSMLRSNILYFAAIEDVKKRDAFNILYKLIYTALVALVFISNVHDLEAMLLLVVADEIVTVGGTFIKYRLRPGFKFLHSSDLHPVKTLAKIYSLGLVSMLMFLMINLNYNLDVIMLRWLADSYSVGLYSVGVSLANMLFLIPDAFKDVLFHKTAKSDAVKDILFSIRLNLLLDIVLIAGFAIFGQLFIRIMFGEEFIGAYPITLVLFLGSLSMVIYKMVHPLYISKGRQKTVFMILLASVLLNAAANLVLIPLCGTMGAAWASVLSYTACSVIFLVVFCKDYHVSMRMLLGR